MTDKHKEVECNLCGKGFNNKTDLTKHIEKCSEKNVTIVQCPSCKQNFAQGALKKHTTRGKCKLQITVRFAGTDCNLVSNNAGATRKHMREEHMEINTRSREVCRHYRRGNCLKGDSCTFSHVGAQILFQHEINSTQTTTRRCWNKEKCVWLQRGGCHFFHEGVRVQAARPTPPQGSLPRGRTPSPGSQPPSRGSRSNSRTACAGTMKGVGGTHAPSLTYP